LPFGLRKLARHKCDGLGLCRLAWVAFAQHRITVAGLASACVATQSPCTAHQPLLLCGRQSVAGRVRSGNVVIDGDFVAADTDSVFATAVLKKCEDHCGKSDVHVVDDFGCCSHGLGPCSFPETPRHVDGVCVGCRSAAGSSHLDPLAVASRSDGYVVITQIAAIAIKSHAEGSCLGHRGKLTYYGVRGTWRCWSVYGKFGCGCCRHGLGPFLVSFSSATLADMCIILSTSTLSTPVMQFFRKIFQNFPNPYFSWGFSTIHSVENWKNLEIGKKSCVNSDCLRPPA